MCGCFYLGAHGSSDSRPPPSPPSPSSPARDDANDANDASARALADESPWIDVHAHPGRCFLGGLAADDPYVKLLGEHAMPEALADQGAGRVALSCYATVSDFKILEFRDGGLCASRPFEPGEAHADHLRQLDAIRDIWARDSVQPVRTPDDITSAHRDGRRGVMITCEGADFLEGDLARVEEAFEASVRSITLVHYRVNELGDIQTERPVHHGLSAFGREVVQEMNRLGMIVDLAHATYAATLDALDAATAPAMISHSHLAAGEGSHPRLLSIEHACAVADAGGLIGAWPAGVAARNLDDYVDEIVRLIDLVGARHVAIGTDLDANYQPVMTRYDQYPMVAAGLLQRGVEAGDVRLVMGGSFLELFRAVSEAAAA